MQSYFSHGKLLVTAEYVVLDNALALAIPTKYGQKLEVKVYPNAEDRPQGNNSLIWRSFDSDGNIWYYEEFVINTSQTSRKIRPYSFDACNLNPTTDRIVEILSKAMELNPDFLYNADFEVKVSMDFPKSWGLGSSSTLICNVAKWAGVDAFQLSDASFGGSGYDIAVGMIGGDILYRSPEMWEGYVFNPAFKDQLYFVHLNQKQNSRDGIKKYRSKELQPKQIKRISEITEALIAAKSLDKFQELINEHEQIIASIVEMPTVKDRFFKDYPYAMKSLGAWGGDFILACGDKQTPQYFIDKGYPTVLSFKELIK